MALFRIHVVFFVAITSACVSSLVGAADTLVETESSRARAADTIVMRFLSKHSERSQGKHSNSDDNTIILKMGSSSKLNDYYLWKKFAIGDKKVLILFEKKSAAEVAAEAFGRVLATALIASLCAYLYQSKKEYPLPEAAEVSEGVPLTQWSSGLFDCCQDPYIFLCACCCMPIRWADTMDMVGLMKFWTAFAFILVLQLCAEIPFLGVFWFGIIGVLTMHRQKLRGIFQIPGQGDGGTTVGDAFFVCCCMPCAVAQEARHVELAAKLGHEAVVVQRPIKEGMENSEAGRYTGQMAAPTEPAAQPTEPATREKAATMFQEDEVVET